MDMDSNQDKIERIRFHDLRHLSVLLILGEGVNMKIVQKRLGHKDIRTTLNMYSHISTEDEQNSSDVFNVFSDSSIVPSLNYIFHKIDDI